jgi:hypothetical protein
VSTRARARVSCGCSEEREKTSRANKVVAEALGAASTTAKASASAKEIRRARDTPSNVASTRRRGGKEGLLLVNVWAMSKHVSMTSHSPRRTTHKASLLLPPLLPPLASQVERLGQAWRGTAAALLFMPCAPHLIVLFLALSSICPVSCLSSSSISISIRFIFSVYFSVLHSLQFLSNCTHSLNCRPVRQQR